MCLYIFDAYIRDCFMKICHIINIMFISLLLLLLSTTIKPKAFWYTISKREQLFHNNLTWINVFKDIALGVVVVVVLEMLLDECFSIPEFYQISKRNRMVAFIEWETKSPNVYPNNHNITHSTLNVFGIRCQSVFRKGICLLNLLSHHLFSHRILIYLWHSRASRRPAHQPSICDPIKHDTPCPTVKWTMFTIELLPSNSWIIN